jgi:demethylmenaquinone methyltransferase/2-methoxy-6-polyprenyl-1,4-benzoquinol methylase
MEDLLESQLAYYRARAAEYDEWWERRGRYDHGAEQRARWRAEEQVVDAALEHFAARGDVLDLAAGTGIWTAKLARTAASITVADASPEMLAINQDRVEAACTARGIGYVQIGADLFDWRPPRTWDVVFFGFWLSHVPPGRFDAFWSTVRACLSPGGRVFFVDSLPDRRSQANGHSLPDAGDIVVTRLLNDGSMHRIVKRFFVPAELEADLAKLGFAVQVRTSGDFFLYGSGGLQAP